MPPNERYIPQAPTLDGIPVELRLHVYSHLPGSGLREVSHSTVRIAHKHPSCPSCGFYVYGLFQHRATTHNDTGTHYAIGPCKRHMKSLKRLDSEEHIETAILLVSRKLYREALPLLYEKRVFVFDAHGACLLPSKDHWYIKERIETRMRYISAYVAFDADDAMFSEAWRTAHTFLSRLSQMALWRTEAVRLPIDLRQGSRWNMLKHIEQLRDISVPLGTIELEFWLCLELLQMSELERSVRTWNILHWRITDPSGGLLKPSIQHLTMILDSKLPLFSSNCFRYHFNIDPHCAGFSLGKFFHGEPGTDRDSENIMQDIHRGIETRVLCCRTGALHLIGGDRMKDVDRGSELFKFLGPRPIPAETVTEHQSVHTSHEQ